MPEPTTKRPAGAMKELLDALPQGLRRCAGAIVSRLRIARSFGLSSLFVRSANDARELRAVASGLAEFERTSGVRESADYVLRRNTHRIEKGMISRPRRGSFATSYIEETVEHLADAVAGNDGVIEPGSELAWSRDVLSTYFGIIDESPEVERARARFESSIDDTTPDDGVSLSPFIRDLGGAPPVSYEALRDLSMRRRSVRWFEDRPVPRSLIDDALAVAAQSPSACNRQPFEFYVYDDPQRVQRISAVPGGTVGFSHNFPVMVAIVGLMDAFFSERDRHVAYIDGSLAAMSFMLALEALGLSSCAINTPGVEEMERQLCDELGLAAWERPIMLIALGYPDATAMVPRSQKKLLGDLRRYNP